MKPMQVIAGEAKGRRLRGPKGTLARPATGLVRGAIFSMLEALGADLTRVLDLYAGVGSLGIEALSRGAKEVVFVEQTVRGCAAIRENLERTGYGSRGRVWRMPVRRALGKLVPGPFSLVFVDPPFSTPELPPVLQELTASPLVAEESTIVVRHFRRTSLQEQEGPFRRVRQRRHGDSVIAIYRWQGAEE